ncbi:MAG: hypothetical protein A2Y51_02320 [Gallionellales bacterium RIFCSPLOWO2_02_60_31]|nr:MAG: hypothetical protein A2Y51_02320 [Gallionellales bacterium RIFCSPLOWO2_02_60_31]
MAGSSVGNLPSLAIKIPTSQRSGVAKFTVMSISRVTGVPLTQEETLPGATLMPVRLTSLAVQTKLVPKRAAAQSVAANGAEGQLPVVNVLSRP